ncbi:pollen-specific leucine-rich repeat extensin-like protein 1 [Helianthus annuus]|uniref:pollen-specific leucine-rich repeat extensin-like protein 1 n=1 Tax=Helianthus annuus TaxID=4232 RepID=UPI000B8F2F60|nr:pollen-specific leucine-rich repeat extensin-like protein 1 [Helianthus annuus]
MESSPVIKTNTTTSGGNLDDPFKVGDELRYKELTDRMSSVENIVGEMKQMMKQMLEASKSQPSHQQITQELWNSVQLILAAQRELAELNHNKHMALIRVMVEARYNDTQTDIRGNKESLQKLTSSSPAPGQQKQKPGSAKETSTKTSEKSDVGKKRGIDETLNIQIDGEILAKQKKHDTEKSKAYNWKKEQEEKMKRENISTSLRRKSFRNNRPPITTFPKTSAALKRPVSSASPKTKPSPQKPPQKKQKIASKPISSPIKPTDVDATKASADVRPTAVETHVVSADVSQSTTTINFNTPPSTQRSHTPQRFPSQPPSLSKPPSPSKVPPPPKFVYLRKRKFVVHDDDKEIPSPIPLSSVPSKPLHPHHLHL